MEKKGRLDRGEKGFCKVIGNKDGDDVKGAERKAVWRREGEGSIERNKDIIRSPNNRETIERQETI